MDIHEYNKTFYYGLSSLFFLGIIALFTYLFKFKNIQNFINLFILFIILLLVIYCNSVFKDNIIEDFLVSDQSVSELDTDTRNNNKTVDIAVAIADEPFGRFNVNFLNPTNGFNIEDSTNGAVSCFTNLYNLGYRGFHFYVEYPLNDDVPQCVFPYKDTAGMNGISTRGTKFPLSTVISEFTNALSNIDNHQLIYLCITCLSTKEENDKGKINSQLFDTFSDTLKEHRDEPFSTVYNSSRKVFVTLGTYDNMPLTQNQFSTHYFIKENDLKYAAFNVAVGFGVYLPLLNYTKEQQDTFNSRGYDEDMQQSVNLAYLNGVQFVCIPPTKNGKIVDKDTGGSYDYPTTVAACNTYFTDISTNVITSYKKRTSSFISSLHDIQQDIDNKFTINSTKISRNSSRLDIIDGSFAIYDIDDIEDRLSELE